MTSNISNISSFFSPADDTFLNTRNKRPTSASASPLPIGNSNGDRLAFSPLRESTFNENLENTSLPNISVVHNEGLKHSLPTDCVSPYLPIKSLIESPLRQSYDSYSTSLTERHTGDVNGIGIKQRISDDRVNANTLLKMKIKAHQRQFQNEMENIQSKFKSVNTEIDNNTYLHSAFGSKRQNPGLSMTHLKNIGSTENNRTNSLNMLPIEPLQTPNFPLLNSDRNQSEKKPTETLSSIQNLSDPYVVKALGRIVNKEFEMRKLLYGMLVFFVYRFLRSIVRLFVYTNPNVASIARFLSKSIYNMGEESVHNSQIARFLKCTSRLFTFENLLKIGTYLDYIIMGILLMVVLSASFRLLKPQDKCLDLPLSNAQRKILGLSLSEKRNGKTGTAGDNDEEDDETEELMKKLIASSPQKMEQPTRVVVPDSKTIEDVMGGLNGLALNRNERDVGNMTWSSGMFSTQKNNSETENIKNKLSQRDNSLRVANSFDNGTNNANTNNNRRDFVSPSGKYMFGVNNELKNNENYGTYNSSFY